MFWLLNCYNFTCIVKPFVCNLHCFVISFCELIWFGEYNKHNELVIIKERKKRCLCIKQPLVIVYLIVSCHPKTLVSVCYNDSTNCSSVYLHGHQIATLDHQSNALKLSSCGYQTNTTKSRLNAIFDEIAYGSRVFQKHWDWYFSGNNKTVDFWDGMILCGGQIL